MRPEDTEKTLPDLRPLLSHFNDFLGDMEEKREGKGLIYSTSLDKVDYFTGGLDKGEIMTIGGLTGAGKTTLAMQMAFGLADIHKNILYLSLEMTPAKLAGRLFCNQADVDNQFIRTGLAIEKDYPEKLDLFKKTIAGTDLQIIKSGYDFQEIVDIIKTGYQGKKPDVLFIDFIQNIRWGGRRTQNEAIVQYIRDLSELSQTYGTSIVLVSQIRRSGDSSQTRKPTMFDLLGSGSIEQASAIVLIIYKKVTNSIEFGKEKENVTYHLSIEKNRQGEITEVPINFMGRFYKMEEI